MSINGSSPLTGPDTNTSSAPEMRIPDPTQNSVLMLAEIGASSMREKALKAACAELHEENTKLRIEIDELRSLVES